MPRNSQLVALFKMNARDFLRNRTAAVMTFLLPLIFVVVFGVTSAGGGVRELRLAVVDLVHDAESARFAAQLDASSLVEVRVTSTDASIAAFRAGEVDAALVVPRHGLDGSPCPPNPPENRDCRLVLYASPGTAALIAPLLDARSAGLALERAGAPTAFAYATVAPVQATGMFTFILPGILALALLQLGLMGTATPLMVARENGTLRHLASTPVSPVLVLVAQLLLRLLIGMLQIAVILGVAVLAFDLRVSGSLLGLLPVLVLGASMMIAIGYAIAGIAPSREGGHAIVMLLNFTMMFLGGVFFSTRGSWLDVASKLSPMSYLADAARQLTLGAGGALPLIVNLVAMAGWTALAVAIALRTFRFDMKEHAA